MSLFVGQELENRHRRTDLGTQEGKGEGETNSEIKSDIYAFPCVNRQLVGSCCP